MRVDDVVAGDNRNLLVFGDEPGHEKWTLLHRDCILVELVCRPSSHDFDLVAASFCSCHGFCVVIDAAELLCRTGLEKAKEEEEEGMRQKN